MAYLLDANVLITAHRQWYGFDFVPGFWSWVEQAHAARTVSSVARVRDELAGDDLLASWVQGLPSTFFVRDSAADGAAFRRVANWAAIPDACAALNVAYCTPYAMLRRERARFVLLPTSSSDGGAT